MFANRLRINNDPYIDIVLSVSRFLITVQKKAHSLCLRKGMNISVI